MEFLIISGLSGAGKTRVADVLEDIEYYCVDNMPAALLPKLAEFCMGMGSRYEKVALVTDIRDTGGAEAVFDALDQLRKLECAYKILFIEASVATLIRRYKESRRPHPLQAEVGSIENAVELETMRLSPLRDKADYIIDTSSLTLGQLQTEIYTLLVGAAENRTLRVNVMSFGFKYGIPSEADMVLDVRFLPNPFYIWGLRDKSGMDADVYDYVFSHAAAREFVDKLRDLLAFLLPHYVEEGKHILTVAVGCTGGRHRSVAIALQLADCVTALGHKATLINRDMEKK